MAENLHLWSTTSSANASADPGINWAEGQLPGSINDSARGMMAAQAKWLADNNGTLVSGGSANAQTLAPNTSHAALVDGLVVSFAAGVANTAATTLNFASLGAKKVRYFGASGEADLYAGALVLNGHYVVQYELAADAGAGAWILLNPTPTAAISGTSGTFSGNVTAYDLGAARSATTGYLFLGSNSAHYVGFDGASYVMGNGALAVGGGVTCTSLNTQNGAITMGTATLSCGSISAGDVYASRSASTGYLFFGTNSGHYLGFDGANYQLVNGGLVLGGPLSVGTVTSSGNLNATSGTVTAAALTSTGNASVAGTLSFGTLSGGGITCTTIQTNNNTITCGNINSLAINTQGYNITTGGGTLTCGPVSSGVVTCTGVSTRNASTFGTIDCYSIEANGQPINGGTATFGGMYSYQHDPRADNTYTLGSASARWNQLYAGTTTINTSDAREKTMRGGPEDAVFEAVLAVPLELYQWNEAIKKKGPDGARLHYGPTVQGVAREFRRRKIDPRRFALYCEDRDPKNPRRRILSLRIDQFDRLRNEATRRRIETLLAA